MIIIIIIFSFEYVFITTNNYKEDTKMKEVLVLTTTYFIYKKS